MRTVEPDPIFGPSPYDAAESGRRGALTEGPEPGEVVALPGIGLPRNGPSSLAAIGRPENGRGLGNGAGLTASRSLSSGGGVIAFTASCSLSLCNLDACYLYARCSDVAAIYARGSLSGTIHGEFCTRSRHFPVDNITAALRPTKFATERSTLADSPPRAKRGDPQAPKRPWKSTTATAGTLPGRRLVHEPPHDQ